MSRNNSGPLDPEIMNDGPGQEMGLDAITRGEFDMLISTAKRYPRNIALVKEEMLAMATLDEETAASCFYSLDRKGEGGKRALIQGPSIRMAEIALCCFGNVRAATRGLGETDDGRFVRELGVCYDVQKNVMVAKEVRRRITTRDGRRYGDDMVGVTMAAAASIALRNAILTVVPRALIKPVVDAAKDVALGKSKSLTLRRTEIIDRLRKLNPIITLERILSRLERRSMEEVTWEDLEHLIGLGTSIKDGMQSVEEAFPDPATVPTAASEILGTQTTPVGAPLAADTPETAARRGKLARQGGHGRETCRYPPGPLQDVWLLAWDAEEPLPGVAPQQGPTPAGDGDAAGNLFGDVEGEGHSKFRKT